MAKLKLALILSSGIAMSCFLPVSHAASRLAPEKAALCSAAMKIKRTEFGHSLRDTLDYHKAADWFSASGQESFPSGFASLEASHRKLLETEKSNGSSKFTKAVSGCLEYYKTSSGE